MEKVKQPGLAVGCFLYKPWENDVLDFDFQSKQFDLDCRQHKAVTAPEASRKSTWQEGIPLSAAWFSCVKICRDIPSKHLWGAYWNLRSQDSSAFLNTR